MKIRKDLNRLPKVVLENIATKILIYFFIAVVIVGCLIMFQVIKKGGFSVLLDPMTIEVLIILPLGVFGIFVIGREDVMGSKKIVIECPDVVKKEMIDDNGRKHFFLETGDVMIETCENRFKTMENGKTYFFLVREYAVKTNKNGIIASDLLLNPKKMQKYITEEGK